MQIGVIGKGLGECRVGESGAKRVHANALPGQCDPHVTGHLHHTALGMRVWMKPIAHAIGVTDKTDDRGHVYYRARALFFHLFHGKVRHHHRPLQVDADSPVPLLFPVPLSGCIPGRDPGAVYQHIDPAVLLDRPGDHGFAICPRCNVPGKSNRIATIRYHRIGNIFGGVDLQVCNHDFRAFTGKQMCRGIADARPAARDKRHLAFESLCHS